MKTTRNSPRARKERAVAKRFLRLERTAAGFLGFVRCRCKRCCCPHRDSTGGEYDTRSDYSWSEIRVDAPYLGTKLGERLRPCPGCCNCQPCFGPKACRRVCDGSGVLPATKTKRL